MELFLYSFASNAGKLKRCRLYKQLEKAFVNWALNFSLWQLNTMEGEAFNKTYNLLKREDLRGWILHDMTEATFLIQRNICSF